jgi:hypothetical protein
VGCETSDKYRPGQLSGERAITRRRFLVAGVRPGPDIYEGSRSGRHRPGRLISFIDRQVGGLFACAFLANYRRAHQRRLVRTRRFCPYVLIKLVIAPERLSAGDLMPRGRAILTFLRCAPYFSTPGIDYSHYIHAYIYKYMRGVCSWR